jgi:hypothetical protein
MSARAMSATERAIGPTVFHSLMTCGCFGHMTLRRNAAAGGFQSKHTAKCGRIRMLPPKSEP